MRQALLITGLIVPLLCSCNIQTERIEKKLMDCHNLAFTDGGKQLKELITDYESNLLKADIISNTTGKSYLNTIIQISKGIEPKEKPYYSFSEMLNGIETNQNSALKDCFQKTVSDSAKYDFKKFLTFQKTLEKAITTDGDLRIELLASEISKVLSEKDFELDFYKMRAFLLFDMLRPNNEINKVLPKTDHDLENAFRIYLNKEGNIIANNTEVKIKNLKPIIVQYLKNNKSKSVILIKTDSETMYSDYLDVQNEIQRVINSERDNLSNEKYQKKYSDLNSEEQKTIDEQYPKSIIDE